MLPLPTPFLITSLKYLLHFLSTFTPNLLHSKNLLRYFAVFCDTFSLKKNVCKPWFQANFSIFSSALFCCQRWGINIIIPHRWTEIISLDKSFFFMLIIALIEAEHRLWREEVQLSGRYRKLPADERRIGILIRIHPRASHRICFWLFDILQ